MNSESMQVEQKFEFKTKDSSPISAFVLDDSASVAFYSTYQSIYQVGLEDFEVVNSYKSFDGEIRDFLLQVIQYIPV